MIRLVWGTGTGPTAIASYDAALADANLHDYNLVRLSSVIPAAVPVERTETAPELGPVGAQLPVVEGRATISGPGTASAGLGWTRQGPGAEGPGVFYEAGGEGSEASVRTELLEGLQAARRLRSWGVDPDRSEIQLTSTSAPPGTYATAVVLAAYGRASPIVTPPEE